MEIGGYELRTDTGSVFVTDNFFSLLGKPEMQGEPLSVRRFEEVLKGIREKNPCDHTAEGDELLTIQQPDGVRYIMLRSTIEGHAKIGLAEDVTAAVLERKRIEHERDHDILTGLYNRQAFNRVCTELFAAPERMGVAALMMMDLDNLKHINDTYGHDWGDQYIRRTGQCLRDNTPAGTVCARLSGDEFLVLFHGYRSRDAVREKIDCLTKAMQQSVALLPSGNALHISLSGGIAWYPDDGQDWETLKKYADFAMYQVKHSEKGRVEEFDIGVYNREAYAERTRREFRQLLSNAQMFYCFQPIFSARSGRVVAYEALMRSDLPTLRSPATIMKLAREQGALYEIERLTFTKALETFDSLCRAGSVSGDAMLFVNSIASTCLTQADVDYIDSRWHELRRRMVIEITEEEAIDYEALERKRDASGLFRDVCTGRLRQRLFQREYAIAACTPVRQGGYYHHPWHRHLAGQAADPAQYGGLRPPPQHEDRCRGRGDRRRAAHGHRAGRRPFAGLFSGTPGHCAGSNRAGSSGDHPGVAAPEKRLKYMPSRALRRWEGFCNGGKKIWFRWISSPAFWAQARPPFCAAMCGIWYSRDIRCAFWKTTLAR